MWNNYFFEIQKKYNMRISSKTPFVIRLDGKSVTRNYNISFFDLSTDSFSYSLQQTAKYFSEKYNCLSIFGSDEISFIFTDISKLMEDCSSDNSHYSNEIISMFSQYFFDYFYSIYDKKIFWHAKCFSIPDGKINSYIKYRSNIIKNVMVTYFLKRNNINLGKLKLDQKLDYCKSFDNYTLLDYFMNGFLYFDGYEISIPEFYNSNIVKINNSISNDNSASNLYIDLLNF